MPIYTYRCDNCGVQFDQSQKFSDPSLTRCPECGKKTLHKVYTPVGIVFKGSGFYATDNRSPSGQAPRTNDHHSHEKSESGTSIETKAAETKPAESKSTESKKAETAAS